MKLKLDENLDRQAEELLRRQGHDVQTAAAEKLWGSEDAHLIQICRSEGRCLVTLDMEFNRRTPQVVRRRSERPWATATGDFT
jgi:predicted nuclease of predicted toxin-antitoxin system